MSNKIVLDTTFFDPSDKHMYTLAEKLAVAMDFHHACNDFCDNHDTQLHVRVNDTRSGKGNDYWFGVMREGGV